MSDVMLMGVLRMPPELWRDDPLDVAQRHSRYVQAADEIDRLRADRALLLNAARRAVTALAAAAERQPEFATDYAMLARSLERFRGEWPTEPRSKE